MQPGDVADEHSGDQQGRFPPYPGKQACETVQQYITYMTAIKMSCISSIIQLLNAYRLYLPI